MSKRESSKETNRKEESLPGVDRGGELRKEGTVKLMDVGKIGKEEVMPGLWGRNKNEGGIPLKIL